VSPSKAEAGLTTALATGGSLTGALSITLTVMASVSLTWGLQPETVRCRIIGGASRSHLRGGVGRLDHAGAAELAVGPENVDHA
jgi:hypothetical protein